jgi:hypothetical protein
MGTPAMVSPEPATLTVRVRHNQHCPQFSSPSGFSANIDQTLGVGGLVLTVTATDR